MSGVEGIAEEVVAAFQAVQDLNLKSNTT